MDDTEIEIDITKELTDIRSSILELKAVIEKSVAKSEPVSEPEKAPEPEPEDVEIFVESEPEPDLRIQTCRRFPCPLKSFMQEDDDVVDLCELINRNFAYILLIIFAYVFFTRLLSNL